MEVLELMGHVLLNCSTGFAVADCCVITMEDHNLVDGVKKELTPRLEVTVKPVGNDYLICFAA